MLTLRFEILHTAAGERVLDLGCGGGRHTFEALRRGCEVVAGDIDEAALKDVAAWCGAITASGEAGTGGGFSCTVADALRLPFADGSFDRVIVSEVLEHVAEDRRAFREVERVTRAGGTIAVTVPRWWPEVVCWALSKEYHSNAGGHVRIYRRRHLLSRAAGVGLEPYAMHHAHALHAPYWWLKCLVGVRKDEARLPSLYHRFLVRDMTKPRAWVRGLESFLNPVLGKSLVVYLKKPAGA